MPPAISLSRQPLLSATNPFSSTTSRSNTPHTSAYLNTTECKPHSQISSPTLFNIRRSIESPNSNTSHPFFSNNSCPSPTTTQNTLIIFDWDDTLLPSSYLGNRRCKLDSDFKNIPYGNIIKAELDKLDLIVSSVLQLASNYGTVHIITNAEHGWVQLSAAKFLPRTATLLPSFVIHSARTAFENTYPDAPLKWKMSSFSHYISEFLSSKTDLNAEKHVISLGDSQLERHAVRTTTRGHRHPNIRTKSIKLSENPTIESLGKQMELISQCFHYICTHNADLDLQMSISTNSHYHYQDRNDPSLSLSPAFEKFDACEVNRTTASHENVWKNHHEPKENKDLFSDGDDMDACGEIGAEDCDDNSIFDSLYAPIHTAA